MYCPRCGSPNTETTKFCRQCGLSMSPVAGYIATGGTGPLPSGLPAGNSPIAKMTDGLSPKQRMILTILMLILAIPVMAILDIDVLVPIVALLMPLGVIWTVFRYKAQIRKMELEQAQQHYVQPVAQPVAQPMDYQQPALPQQPYRPPLPPQGTNPLNAVQDNRGSVTEDETRRFRDREN